MAPENSRWLQRVLGPALKQRGYKKSGATWWRDGADAIAVINIQGSQWGPSFYLNLGVYFRALGDSDRPAVSRCHIQTRLCGLVPDREELDRLLDFGELVAESVRADRIEALVVDHGVPWLEAVSTVDGARDYCKSQAAKTSAVMSEARAFLEAANGA